nr:hypothetical protein GCM10025730_26630 [Promicromonospora thailandica]
MVQRQDDSAAHGGLQEAIAQGRTALGIELGSTRIKACLVGPDNAPLASGSHDWENQLADGVWTYSLDAVRTGLQEAVATLLADVESRYGVRLTTVGALGVSAMMHGYLAFDEAGELLVPFRTWRNTSTERAAAELTALFGHNVPQRWSVAHLYQAVLDEEPHVPRVRHLTTLAGYVHRQLTGRHVLGVGDASGMFPIDVATTDYDQRMLAAFDERAAGRVPALAGLLPAVLPAGADAGELTAEGAAFLDPTGTLRPGIPLCPPEGDAGTGMVATSSVAPRTGNVSAGTSIFAMVVLERPLEHVHEELDLVTTPAGTSSRWCTATTAPASWPPGRTCSASSRPRWAARPSRAPSSRRSCGPRWTATPTAAGCSPTTTCRASRSRAWRPGAPWSRARRTAASPWPTSHAPRCTARSAP